MALTSPGLIKAANDALVGISADINALALFATDFSADAADYGSTIKVPVANATADDYNASTNNYDKDSGSVTYASVVLDKQPKATFAAPKTAEFEAPNAPYWARMKTALVNAIQGAVSTKIGGLFTTTACTGGKAVLASVTAKGVANLRTACLGRVANTVLALSPTCYADLLALLDSSAYGGAEAVRNGYIPGLYGFKAVTQMLDLPSGVLGALIPQDAVAVAARGTLKTDAGLIEAETVTDEFGFPVTVARHLSTATRTEYLNADLMFGAALVQPSKIKYIAAS